MASKLQQIENEFKENPLVFIRENFSLIIGLPALLGGLLQVFELTSLSFSYLRFFSISQIIPDGLLVILFLSIFLFVGFILKIIFYKIDKKEEKAEDENTENIPKLGTHPIFITVVIFLIYISVIFIGTGYLGGIIIDSVIGLVVLVLGYFVLIIIGMLCWGYVVTTSQALYKDFFLKMGLILFMPIIFSFFNLFSQFHNIYLFPKELRNSENIKCYIQNNINKDIKMNIEYLNDRYIFVKVQPYTLDKSKKVIDTNFSSKQLQIIPFETILDLQPCTEMIKKYGHETDRLGDSFAIINRNLELKIEKSIKRLDSFQNAQDRKK